MMKQLFAPLGLFLLLAHLGCSAQTSEPVEPDSGPKRDAETAVDSDAGTAKGVLLAPVLVSLMPMHGGLHVMWENKQAGCDAIQGERKDAADLDFKLLFTIPDGTVDNKHDATVASGKTYTYRVRCKKGAEFSVYSNEIKASP
jgi:hypothetical protein